MPSMLMLMGLALVNFASAGPCKPSGHTTASTAIQSLSLTSSFMTTDISEVPSLTVSDSATTTQEALIIITNAISGGSFNAPDLTNPPSNLKDFGAEGNAEFHQTGCYKGDNSLDDGCAALSATGSPAGKRDLGSIASIFQTLSSLNTGAQSLYTVQFFYIVASAGSQACTVSATLGENQFYSESIASIGTKIAWTRVIKSVAATSASARFAISMTCSGNGVSMIFVDSIFISNQVTPNNINDFILDFGTPVAASSSQIVAVPTTSAAANTEETKISSTISPSNTESSFQPTDNSQSTNTEKTIPSTSAANPTSAATSDVTTHAAQQISSTSVPQNQETTSSPLGTTVPESEQIISTSQPAELATTTKSSQPTETTCKPTCQTPNDSRQWRDEWNCQVYGFNRGQSYELPGQENDDTRRYFQNPTECAEICETIPGCVAIGYMFASARCRFSNTEVTQAQVNAPSSDDIDGDWYGMKCFTCSGCEATSAPGIASITSRVIETTTQPPERTTFTTSTSDPPATSTTPACLYNRGQECEFNRFKDHSDTLCIWAGVFNGRTWTESRADYPFQDGPYQCAAICQTLENCESAGYYSTENRCLFTSKKLQRTDMTTGRDFDASVWSHNSCWTCPSCVYSSQPLPTSSLCSYKQGDACKRVSGKPGSLCNYQGMWEWYNEQTIDRYPDQSSPEKCAAICRTEDYCKGSGYKDGKCMFSFGELKIGNFRDWPDHSRDGIWDDPSCFVCPGCSN
ncbi:uncharacterized protein FTOL_06516 [Fusarium torulosum]|uniref:Apple domain-containing protein n=1 Tax=Fusarium torulosum TaxID=33205 RepID=A0AAE8SIW6_9HYPO|nr:uncharacterized protein FTOL_06516 [Fusarium torulosum]